MNRTQVSRPGRHATAVIRPVGPADLPALGDFFAGLSVQTRYLRFFGPVTPTPDLLRLLSGRDARVHALVAVAGGVIVGHAMASDRPDPEGWPGTPGPPGSGPARTADIGLVVADAWQGRGVGSALMRALTAQAAARGVTSLTMDVLHANRQVVAMVLGHWPDAVIGHSRDSLGIRVRPPRYQPGRLPAPPAARRDRPLVTVAG